MTVKGTLPELAARRWRIAIGLTIVMTVVYLAFILLIAYGKGFLGTVIVPGLSVGIVLGTLVIAVAWLVIVIYVRWANRHYDGAIAGFRRDRAPRP